MVPIPLGLKKKFKLPDTAPPAVCPPDWLGAEVDKAIAFTLRGTPNVFHASSLGDEARIMFLKYIGVYEDRINATIARAFGTGSAVHERWVKDLQKAKLLITSEETVVETTNLPVRGRLDFIVRDPQGQPCLIEFKTINTRGFEQLSEPKREHLVQAVYYMTRKGLQNGYVVYEEKSSHEIKYFQVVLINGDVTAFLKGKEVSRWPKLLDTVFEDLQYVMWCSNNGAIPVKCIGCSLSGRCRHPKICGPQEASRKLVTKEEWRRLSGNVRPDSGTSGGDSNSSTSSNDSRGV